jgi:hypothetical protein
MIHDRNAAVPSEIPMDTVWSTLEAANELGDAQTVEACRRVIDAHLLGTPPTQSDVNAVAAFFG